MDASLVVVDVELNLACGASGTVVEALRSDPPVNNPPRESQRLKGCFVLPPASLKAVQNIGVPTLRPPRHGSQGERPTPHVLGQPKDNIGQKSLFNTTFC